MAPEDEHSNTATEKRNVNKYTVSSGNPKIKNRLYYFS